MHQLIHEIVLIINLCIGFQISTNAAASHVRMARSALTESTATHANVLLVLLELSVRLVSSFCLKNNQSSKIIARVGHRKYVTEVEGF